MEKTLNSEARQLAMEAWRARDRKPIGVIDLTPGDFSRRWHIQFEMVSDDLDNAAAAVVELPSRAKYLLLRYAHDPTQGTTVYRPASNARQTDLSGLLRSLGITSDHVKWAARLRSNGPKLKRTSRGAQARQRSNGRGLVAAAASR